MHADGRGTWLAWTRRFSVRWMRNTRWLRQAKCRITSACTRPATAGFAPFRRQVMRNVSPHEASVPFTPFHMGPALALKAVSGQYFSVLVFGIAQVAMDIEPLVGMIRNAAGSVRYAWI